MSLRFEIAALAANDEALEALEATAAFRPRPFILGFHSRSLRRSLEDSAELISDPFCVGGTRQAGKKDAPDKPLQ